MSAKDRDLIRRSLQWMVDILDDQGLTDRQALTKVKDIVGGMAYVLDAWEPERLAS